MSDDPTTLYCANHANVATRLRCNRCEKPICAKCAILTPTGYRCKECVRGQQKVYETAQWIDYPLVFIVAASLAGLGAFGVTFIGFITFFLAPIAGGIIAEAARLVTRKRRSKRLYHLAVAAAILGALPFLLMAILSFSLYGIIWQAVYLVMMVTTLYYRLSGINIR